MGSLWGLITIVGPLIFMGVLIYVVIRSRGASRADIERSEQGAVDLREEIRKDPQYTED